MKLRLLAQDGDDLTVLSSVLQDAVVSVSTLHYDKTAMAFTLQGSRLRHEDGSDERIFTGLRIDNVLGVRHRGLDREKTDAFAVLLDMAFAPGDAPGGEVTMVFAGGGEVVLSVEALDMLLADVGDARRARAVPDHALES